ncbi:MAG: hypothetical protein AABY22_20970 [Nanoarchaeota archaeon]
MGVEKVFTGLPRIAQGIIAVVVVGGFGFIGWKIYSAIKKRISLAGSFKEKKEVTNAIQELENKGVKPTFINAQYLTFANQIHAAFDGYGTGFLSVAGIFGKLRNNVDILKLIDAYGIREIDSGKGNPAPNFKGTLAGAISDELSAWEIQQLNKLLKSNKISITF